MSLNEIGTKDNTLLHATSNNVTRLDKIQEKLFPGESPSESQTSAVLDGTKIKGLVGDRGIGLEPSATCMRVKGPPHKH